MKIKSIPMPKSPWLIASVILLLWISRWFLFPGHIHRAVPHPPEGNAIAIPILLNQVLTVVCFPAWCLFLWRVLRQYPAQPRWLAWSQARCGWSLAWTLLAIVGVLASLVSLSEDVKLKLPLHAIFDASWALVWVYLRAVLVSRLKPKTGAADSNAGLRAKGSDK